MKRLVAQLNDALQRATGYRLARQSDRNFFEHIFWARAVWDEAHPIHDTNSFQRFVIDHVHESVSEHLQDLWVLYELGTQSRGYFVEFGAVDGLLVSNTLLLERSYQWTGIVAEPHPAMQDRLRRNRPSATVDTRCVWRTSGEQIEFLIGQGEHEVHSTVAESYRGNGREGLTPVSVPTISLADLLTEHNAPPIVDYLSIDTEGSEFDILSAYDWSRPIRCITVEHNYDPELRAKINGLLTVRGYVQRFADASFNESWYRLTEHQT